jgi:hypothetical protein
MYTPDCNVTNMSCPLGHFSRDTAKCDAWLYEDNERTIVGEVCGPYIASQPIPTDAEQAAILGSLLVAPFDSYQMLARGSDIRVFICCLLSDSRDYPGICMVGLEKPVRELNPVHNDYREFLGSVHLPAAVTKAACRRSGSSRTKPIFRADKVHDDVSLN